MKHAEQRLQGMNEDTIGADHDSAVFPYRARSKVWSASSRCSFVWRLISFSSSLLLSVFVPFYLTFVFPRPAEIPAYTPYIWALFLTDLIAVADVLKGFRTSFIRRDGTEELDPSEVAHRYLKSYCAIDFISAVPWILIGNVVESVRPAVYLIALLRFLRIVPHAWSSVDSRLWQVLRLSGMLYLCTHWFACAWYSIVEEEGEWVPSHDLLLGTDIYVQDAINRYTLFWYSATVVLVQGGEFYCHTELDTVLMVVAEFAGVIGFTLIFSKVFLIVQDEDMAEFLLRDKLDSAESASLQLNLPSNLHRAVLSAVNKQQSAFVFESLLMLNALQDSVYFEVTTAILSPVAEGTVLTTMLGRDVKPTFLKLLQAGVCLPGETLFREFEQSDCLYFVGRGELAATLACLKETLFLVREGEMAGVSCALSFAHKPGYTAVARSNLLVFALTSTRLKSLTDAFPRLKPVFEARMWEESQAWFSRCRPFIDKLPYFAGIPKEVKLELALTAYLQDYDSEATIVKKGSPLSSVIGVFDGRATIQIRMRRKVTAIEELKDGSVFGVYTAAKATNVQTVDVVALEPTRCILFPAELISQLALALPPLSCFNASLHDTPESDFVSYPLTRLTPNARLRVVVLRIIRGAYSKVKLTSIGLGAYLLRRPLSRTVRMNQDIWTLLQHLPSLQASITDKLLVASSNLHRAEALTKSHQPNKKLFLA